MRETYKLKARVSPDNNDVDDLGRLYTTIDSFGKSAKTTNTHIEVIDRCSYICCDILLTQEEASILLLSFTGYLSLRQVDEDDE